MSERGNIALHYLGMNILHLFFQQIETDIYDSLVFPYLNDKQYMKWLYNLATVFIKLFLAANTALQVKKKGIKNYFSI